MTWTIIMQVGTEFTAITDLFGLDSRGAWKAAKAKYPTMVGMFKGDHRETWICYP